MTHFRKKLLVTLSSSFTKRAKIAVHMFTGNMTHVGFDKNKMFSHVNWKTFEAILTLLQEFWIKEQKIGMQADEWYMNYVQFLAVLKNRLTKWKEKEKFRPALPPHIIQKLKEVKRVRNKYYHEKKTGNMNEATRVLLRTLQSIN